MSSTYSNMYFHIIFSTKNRIKFINDDLDSRLYPYLCGIANNNDFKILDANGTKDHCHALLSLKPALSISKTMQLIKGGSSKWIHDTCLDLKNFSWQEGYAVFTVSESQIGKVRSYIGKQKEYHKKISSKDELRELLEMNNIEYNEKYFV